VTPKKIIKKPLVCMKELCIWSGQYEHPVRSKMFNKFY